MFKYGLNCPNIKGSYGFELSIYLLMLKRYVAIIKEVIKPKKLKTDLPLEIWMTIAFNASIPSCPKDIRLPLPHYCNIWNKAAGIRIPSVIDTIRNTQ